MGGIHWTPKIRPPVTRIDGEYDKPSSAAEQLCWPCEAGLQAGIAWVEADLAVVEGDLGLT